MTDAIKIIAENTANFGGGKSPTMRFIEALENFENPKTEEEEKTEEEIIDHIKEKLANL